MNRFLTYGVLLFLAMATCVEPYDFVPGEPGDYLVVSGVLTQDGEVNRIRLSRSPGFGSNATEFPVETAQIALFDSFGNTELLINEGDGFYAHNGSIISPEVGGAYHIEIAYGKKLYKSQPQTMPAPIVPDSVSYEVVYNSTLNELGNWVGYQGIDFFINTPLDSPGNAVYLRWKVDESWMFIERQCHPLHIPKACFISRELSDQKIYLFTSEGIDGTYLSRQKVVTKGLNDLVEFIYKHYINVYQYTMNQPAYEYWEKVRQLAYPDGDIFDLPPAPLSGNVYNVDDAGETVLGYFEVSARATVRLPLFKSNLHPLAVPTMDYLCWTNQDYQEACCYCLVIKNSSTQRPAYWD